MREASEAREASLIDRQRYGAGADIIADRNNNLIVSGIQCAGGHYNIDLQHARDKTRRGSRIGYLGGLAGDGNRNGKDWHGVGRGSEKTIHTGGRS